MRPQREPMPSTNPPASVKLLATASVRLLDSAKLLALRHPKALGEASVTALYDVRILQHSENPQQETGTLQPGQHRLKLAANVNTQLLQNTVHASTVPFSLEAITLASSRELTNLPICKPFIYWRTERHLANGKTRSGNYRRFRIPSALYGDYRSAFLLH
ncbi:hypothetical protein DPMN_189804 [Dreissena polymorpha]|uniref:Uncharacterized protein n=1 Tax=Dreissena polymorpha TaxID=45954 RepID=A0A9D4DU80_DREPO|nr:hypothetical protein DPMN_189804 [Dreissena polymorpha]